MKYVFLGISAFLVALIFHLYFHLGFSSEVVVYPLENREFYLVGKNHVGPYYKISDVISNVEKWAIKNNISCSKTYGLFIDDPKTTEEDRLRSRGGCITAKITGEMNLPEDIVYEHLESREYLKLSFDGSPAISPFIVYPKATKWIKDSLYEFAGPVIELYEVSSPDKVTTYYYFPVKKVAY